MLVTHKAAPHHDNPTSTVSGWWLISGGDEPSLWCQELLCPPWAWGRGSSGSPQYPPCFVPPRELSQFLAPVIFWTFSCGWKDTGGGGGSSVASQGVLEVLYWGFPMLLIAGWALEQDHDVQVPTSQGYVVLLVPAHAIDHPAGDQPWGAAH